MKINKSQALNQITQFCFLFLIFAPNQVNVYLEQTKERRLYQLRTEGHPHKLQIYPQSPITSREVKYNYNLSHTHNRQTQHTITKLRRGKWRQQVRITNRIKTQTNRYNK